MGYKGEIADQFSQLLASMWTSRYACINEPRKFKSIVSKYHEQFRGFQQQDA
jgi:uncharacterized UBP type Zn finger protein